MSKGQEVIAALQQLFGGAVEPTMAVTMMARKIEEQGARLEFLKNIVTGMAFDRGALLNVMAQLPHDGQCLGVASEHGCTCGLDALEAYMNLPVVDLAEKVVGIAQAPPPGRIIT